MRRNEDGSCALSGDDYCGGGEGAWKDRQNSEGKHDTGGLPYTPEVERPVGIATSSPAYSAMQHTATKRRHPLKRGPDSLRASTLLGWMADTLAHIRPGVNTLTAVV